VRAAARVRSCCGLVLTHLSARSLTAAGSITERKVVRQRICPQQSHVVTTLCTVATLPAKRPEFRHEALSIMKALSAGQSLSALGRWRRSSSALLLSRMPNVAKLKANPDGVACSFSGVFLANVWYFYVDCAEGQGTEGRVWYSGGHTSRAWRKFLAAAKQKAASCGSVISEWKEESGAAPVSFTSSPATPQQRSSKKAKILDRCASEVPIEDCASDDACFVSYWKTRCEDVERDAASKDAELLRLRAVVSNLSESQEFDAMHQMDGLVNERIIIYCHSKWRSGRVVDAAPQFRNGERTNTIYVVRYDAGDEHAHVMCGPGAVAWMTMSAYEAMKHIPLPQL